MNTTNTVTFRTAAQAALFECELKGQISDGKWENTPNTGWEQWCRVEVLVGENVGRSMAHVTKDNFNLADRDLLEIVGDRMLGYARLAMAGVTLDDIRKLADTVTDLNGHYKGVPTYEGSYWDDKREWLRRWNLDWLRSVLEDESTYRRDELLADLREMKHTIRTVVSS